MATIMHRKLLGCFEKISKKLNENLDCVDCRKTSGRVSYEQLQPQLL
jgi:hypothetical protein